MSVLATWVGRTRQIYRRDGLISTLRMALTFPIRLFFRYQTYYLVQFVPQDFSDAQKTDFIPDVDNLSFKILSTNQDADELESDGFKFRSHIWNGRERLDKGAIATCTFVGREIAHMVWIALNAEAMKSLYQPPFQVYFTKNEAAIADGWTTPKYRKMGLAPYGFPKRLEFFKAIGVSRVRAVILTNNTASLRWATRAGYRIYAKGRYLKLLRRKFWKEKRLDAQNVKRILHSLQHSTCGMTSKVSPRTTAAAYPR